MHIRGHMACFAPPPRWMEGLGVVLLRRYEEIGCVRGKKASRDEAYERDQTTQEPCESLRARNYGVYHSTSGVSKG